MTANKTLVAKSLVVHCKELSTNYEADNSKNEYTFNAYEFKNGLILVLGESTNDWFFEDRESIEANGNAIVTAIEEKEESTEFSTKQFLESVQGSISEFGEKSVPAKHANLWRK